MQIFAHDVIGEFFAEGGAAERGYADINRGINEMLRKNSIDITYEYTIKDIFKADGLIAVMVDWIETITDRESSKVLEINKEKALDIFKLYNGEWKIRRFIGYPANH